MAATTIIDRTVPHFRSGTTLLIICLTSVFTDLLVGYEGRVTCNSALSKYSVTVVVLFIFIPFNNGSANEMNDISKH